MEAWRLLVTHVTTVPYKWVKRSWWRLRLKQKAGLIQRGQMSLSSRQWGQEKFARLCSFLGKAGNWISLQNLLFFQYWFFYVLNTGPAKRNILWTLSLVEHLVAHRPPGTVSWTTPEELSHWSILRWCLCTLQFQNHLKIQPNYVIVNFMTE